MDTIGVVVSDRDNATLLRMTASKNAEEFKHSPIVTQGTIEAVLLAFAAGEIELEPVDEAHTRKRDIYSTDHLASARSSAKQYTVARLLGLEKDGDPHGPVATGGLGLYIVPG